MKVLYKNINTRFFKKNITEWNYIKDIININNQKDFNSSISDTLLGGTDDIVAYSNLKETFFSNDSVINTIYIKDEFVGYALAMPITRMYPERKKEIHDTFYIYYINIIPEYRGKGLIKPLLDTLLLELYSKGYKFVEIDTRIKDGFADKFQKYYSKYFGVIVDTYKHNKFKEAGLERFFRIDIDTYINQLQINRIRKYSKVRVRE